ncbi:T9SS type A sorting domain-containing protein [uncultured Flavobacterium sp.]|uniref:T9SS type A sorting domain-containing protein n=1 Tax=uncultured Flavobacterium sp. TaxID=165435 RepID=UPI0030EED820
MKKLYILSILFTLTLFLIGSKSIAQDIDLTIKHNTGNNEYEVYANPGFTQSNFTWGPSQITVVKPTSGSQMQNIISSNAGTWTNSNTINYNGTEYYIFENSGSLTNLYINQEILLFSFSSNYGCENGIRLFNNGSDPTLINNYDMPNTIENGNLVDVYSSNYNNYGTFCNFIDAVNDPFGPLDNQVSNTIQILDNDTLGGIPVNPNDVIATINSFLLNGITFYSNPGVIIIPAGVPVGDYIIYYTICELANPINCDTAEITIKIVNSTNNSIDAVNDTSNPVNGANGVINILNILNNDTVNGVVANPSNVTITYSTPFQNSQYGGVILDSNTGLVNVLPNTLPGIYTATYTICEIANPTNCETANVIITVASTSNLMIVANDDDSFASINGTIGATNFINFLSNDTLDGNPVTIADVSLYVLTPATHPNIILDINTGNVNVVPNTLAGTYTITYMICEAANPSNCNVANITLLVTNGAVNYDNLKLIAFYDYNNNGVQDTGELDISNGFFGIQKNTNPIINQYGSLAYVYDLNPANIYNLNYTPINSNYDSCSTTYSNISIATGSGETILYFPVTVIPYIDISVTISQNTPIPGFTQHSSIYYNNHGNQVIPSGTITYTKDSALSISSISQSGTVATPTGFTYDFVNLLPGETRSIIIISQVPTIPTVSLGQLVSCSASITPTDVVPNNNSATNSRPIVGSYDPNDITEVHGEEIVHSTFTSNDYLTYTIRFENTGTANAITVKVDDVLDTKLDETSIRMIGSSHASTLQRIGSNLSWTFDDIQLQPSIPNTETGKSYIVFEVKPKPGYAVGDVIPNTANIYFDFNPAIVTNTWDTEFVTTLSNEVFAFEDFTFYPNPTKNNITIANKSIIDSVEITSVLGQKVMTKNINALSSEIDLSSLSNGIYFVKILSNNQIKTVKVIKE